MLTSLILIAALTGSAMAGPQIGPEKGGASRSPDTPKNEAKMKSSKKKKGEISNKKAEKKHKDSEKKVASKTESQSD